MAKQKSQKEKREFWMKRFGAMFIEKEKDAATVYFLPELPLAPDCNAAELVKRIYDLHLVAKLPEKDRDNGGKDTVGT